MRRIWRHYLYRRGGQMICLSQRGRVRSEAEWRWSLGGDDGITLKHHRIVLFGVILSVELGVFVDWLEAALWKIAEKNGTRPAGGGNELEVERKTQRRVFAAKLFPQVWNLRWSEWVNSHLKIPLNLLEFVWVGNFAVKISYKSKVDAAGMGHWGTIPSSSYVSQFLKLVKKMTTQRMIERAEKPIAVRKPYKTARTLFLNY